MNVYADKIIKLGEDVYFNYKIETYILLGVADGHGGDAAAKLCKFNIKEIFERNLKDDSNMNHVINRTFCELHVLCKELPCHSGCTLTVIIIDEVTGEYTCANVGDSHALHLKLESFMWITTSHRLQDSPAERERLKENISYAGTNRLPYGPPRLYPGGLSCSRNIGDGDCEYVSCEPSVYSDKIENKDAIIVCTDGIWDACQVKKLLSIVRESYNPEFICRLASKNSTDDATVMIVTRQKIKNSLHTGLFKLFSRSGSNSSMSSEENETFVVKVPLDMQI